MQIKKRLRINAIVTVVTAVVILLMLFLALYWVNRAVEASRLADSIIVGALERVALRNDYVRTNSERAKVQWRARHEQIGKLLKAAAEHFRNTENKSDVDEMIRSHESIGNIFAGIVANREKAGLSPDSARLSQEVENRLISQLNMRVYEAILHGRSFQDWGTRTLLSALKFAGGGIICVLAIVVAMAFASSLTMNRAITDRVRRLREGAAVIGGGDLDHRIDIKGDDEFVDLAVAFNAMTAKLRGSYQDLEKQIDVRMRAEEALRRAHDELELRVEERTRELKEAEKELKETNETLEHRVAERTTELQVANTAMLDSRRAALNMMEDAVIARRLAEETSAKLMQEVAERRYAEEELQKSAARLNLLAETASQLLSSESPQKVIDSLCGKIMAFLDCHAFFNFLVDDAAGRLRLNACAGIPEEEKQKIEWLDYGVAVCGCAARDACRIVAEDIPNTPDRRTDLVKSFGIRAYACHPLTSQGRVLGTLSFGTRSRDTFSDDDLSLMKAVADQVAIALERMQAAQSLKKAHDELEVRVEQRTMDLATTVETLLGEVAERERAEESLRRLNSLYAVLSETDQAIVRGGDRTTLFRDFCRIAVEHGGFLLSWVGLVDEVSGEVQIAAACGATGYLDDNRITAAMDPAGEGPTGTSIRQGTYCICNDFQSDPATRPWHEKGRAYGIQSSASIALKEEERVIGALTLYAGEKDFFDRQHVELLRQMGADISFALNSLSLASRRKEAELALQKETMERLQALEELRAKEQLLIQQSRLAALGEMIGNIAHQWRQPLNVLGLILQELSISYEPGTFTREQLDDSVVKALQIIGHMSQTIDGFRNFFRPDKEKTSFNVKDIIFNTVSLVEASLREQQIGVDIVARDELVIVGFPNEYSQVVLNILLNARDAFLEQGPDGPRTIRITLSREQGKSVVTIADNAGGIPEEIMEKIFDPYFTTKSPDKGTGVGLFMSKTIIEKNMSGSLSARNSRGGAIFRIEV